MQTAKLVLREGMRVKWTFGFIEFQTNSSSSFNLLSSRKHRKLMIMKDDSSSYEKYFTYKLCFSGEMNEVEAYFIYYNCWMIKMSFLRTFYLQFHLQCSPLSFGAFKTLKKLLYVDIIISRCLIMSNVPNQFFPPTFFPYHKFTLFFHQFKGFLLSCEIY